MALRRRHRRHPIDGPWIIFEGGGKRTYRRRKTKADRYYDKSQRALSEWGKELIRKEIFEDLYGPKVLPPDLAEVHSSYEDWAKWAKQQIDLNQNAKERK